MLRRPLAVAAGAAAGIHIPRDEWDTGCPGNCLDLDLSGGRKFFLIGDRGMLLDAPLAEKGLHLAPGERADLLVDFRLLAPGGRVQLRNRATTAFPVGLASLCRELVLQFRVSAPSPDTAAVPGHVASLPASLRGGPGQPPLPILSPPPPWQIVASLSGRRGRATRIGSAMSMFLPSLSVGAGAPDRYASVGAGVAVLHGLLIAWLLSAGAVVPLVEQARPMVVRMLEEALPAVAAPVPPVPAKIMPRPQARPVAPAVQTASVPLAAEPAVAAPAPTPAPVAAAPASAAPVEAPVTAARFDADYLHNPKPAYPVASRRLSEEGRVLLRVLVGPEGQAEKIELKATSGFARLDVAAQEAVGRWRFLPARRGEQAISAWVTVPIVFSLES